MNLSKFLKEEVRGNTVYYPEYWCLCNIEDYELKEDYIIDGDIIPTHVLVKLCIPVITEDECEMIMFNNLEGYVCPLIEEDGNFTACLIDKDHAVIHDADWNEGHIWVRELTNDNVRVSENRYKEYYYMWDGMNIYLD